MAAGASSAAHGSKAGGTGSSAHARRVLAALGGVSAAGAHCADAAAARLAALLAGLAALTQQGAGCGVEWRVAALGEMGRAVGRFQDAYPGACPPGEALGGCQRRNMMCGRDARLRAMVDTQRGRQADAPGKRRTAAW